MSATKANGTAKLLIVAYDAKSHLPVINSGSSLARSDYKNWKVIGGGPVASGSVPEEIKLATGKNEAFVTVPNVASRNTQTR